MGMGPIAGAGLALGAAGSAASASAQNSIARAQQAALHRAVGVQQQQVVDAAELERRKRLNEAAMIAGRLRVAAGDAGTGFGGSYQALQRQADYDLALNDAIAARNLRANLVAIRTGGQAQALQIAAQRTNPLLQGLLGGLSGFNAGLSIADGLDRIQATQAAGQNLQAVQKDLATL